ncbi:hypothetical protein GCM10009821_17850 [Aeromicrobium halocynthiae]|uniref:MmcQ/YjbR family DNA-binding protein n=1 Tax=Aeromicrobium halocynthiae TaxID=560557 RepID=A0ABN2W0I7_9ACTN
MARAEVPDAWVRRVRAIVADLPQVVEERAWTGTRWVVEGATFAHLFGGEDQLLRITFRADMVEVPAFEHLGPPYFRAGWSGNAVGMVVDETTDLDELAELLTDSFCVQAPAALTKQVARPDHRAT